jgi:GST-like protein
MIELYYWPTPNGHKAELDYRIHSVNISAGDLVGDTYTIADMAAYPWIVPWKRQQQNLDDFARLRRWLSEIRERPAMLRAYAKGEPYSAQPAVTEEGKKFLFGQTAANRPNT